MTRFAAPALALGIIAALLGDVTKGLIHDIAAWSVLVFVTTAFVLAYYDQWRHERLNGERRTQ